MRKFWLWVIFKPIKFLVFLLASCPHNIRMFMGDVIGILWFDVFRIRRRLVLANIQRAYPDWPKDKQLWLARTSMRNMGRTIMEYPLMPFIDPEKDRDHFILENSEYMDRALAQGRGVCLLTLHLGNGDWATAGLAIHGYPLHMISKEFKWRWLNDIWFGVRRRLGTRFIAPRNSAYHILKALKAKETVVFVLDQFMGPPIGVRTRFFGHETGTALGLAVMVQRSQAPVIPIYTYRRKDGATVIRFEKEIPFEEKGDRDESLAYMTQVYTDCLEGIIRRHPEQWMWVHNRWKVFRDRKAERAAAQKAQHPISPILLITFLFLFVP